MTGIMYKNSSILQKYSDPVLYSVIFLFHSITTTTCYTIIIIIIRIWKLNHWFFLPGLFEYCNKLSSNIFQYFPHLSSCLLFTQASLTQSSWWTVVDWCTFTLFSATEQIPQSDHWPLCGFSLWLYDGSFTFTLEQNMVVSPVLEC